MLLISLFNRKISILSVISNGFIAGSISIGLSVLIDSYFLDRALPNFHDLKDLVVIFQNYKNYMTRFGKNQTEVVSAVHSG